MTISIVIPTYNRGPFIGAAVESALNQSEPADEVLVVDDGSTDDTQTILKQYGKRIRYIEIENNGAGPSRPRNVAIRAVTSTHIMFLDSDDRLEPAAVERCKGVIRRVPDIGLVCTNYYSAHATGAGLSDRIRNVAEVVHGLSSIVVGPGEFRVRGCDAYRAYCEGVFIKTNASTVRKDIVLSIGGFDESLRTANDFDFFLRVLTQGDMVYVDEPLHTVVRHLGNISSANMDGTFREYVFRNYIRVLERELRERGCEQDTARIMRRSLQRWRLEIAYGRRRSGLSMSALRSYGDYVWHGGEVLVAVRGVCATVLEGVRRLVREEPILRVRRGEPTSAS